MNLAFIPRMNNSVLIVSNSCWLFPTTTATFYFISSANVFSKKLLIDCLYVCWRRDCHLTGSAKPREGLEQFARRGQNFFNILFWEPEGWAGPRDRTCDFTLCSLPAHSLFMNYPWPIYLLMEIQWYKKRPYPLMNQGMHISVYGGNVTVHVGEWVRCQDLVKIQSLGWERKESKTILKRECQLLSQTCNKHTS